MNRSILFLQALGESLGKGDDHKDMDIITKFLKVCITCCSFPDHLGIMYTFKPSVTVIVLGAGHLNEPAWQDLTSMS